MLFASVQEIRATSPSAERHVVVDASIAELPLAHMFPHRVVVMAPDGPIVLAPGQDQILGRSCMEHDVLATHIALPDCLTPGMLLAFLDAGAYDRSMSFNFGVGSARTSNVESTPCPEHS